MATSTSTRTEYWCDRRVVLTVEGRGGRRTVELDKPFARIGSHGAADCVLDGRDLPAKICCLFATDDGIFAFGLGRFYQAVHGWLSPGEQLNFGSYRLRAHVTGATPAAGSRGLPLDEPTNPDGKPTVLILGNNRVLGHRTLQRPLTIVGRRRPAHLRLQSRLISGTHCALYWDGSRLWVLDLLSTNGTFVDGERVEVAPLEPGRRLVIGRASIIYAPMSTACLPRCSAETDALGWVADPGSDPELRTLVNVYPRQNSPLVSAGSLDSEETVPVSEMTRRAAGRPSAVQPALPAPRPSQGSRAAERSEVPADTPAGPLTDRLLPNAKARGKTKPLNALKPLGSSPLPAARAPAAERAEAAVCRPLPVSRLEVLPGENADDQFMYHVLNRVIDFGIRKRWKLRLRRMAVAVGLGVLGTLVWLAIWGTVLGVW
ncbi:MAG TPA: FHA domain-containing protein [Planctomycetes bacterium]|nr:FHA domain-containing protein [Planctomycetota bacterium]